jgi:hypothetical protein
MVAQKGNPAVKTETQIILRPIGFWSYGIPVSAEMTA